MGSSLKNNCTFGMSESLGESPKLYFFNDKRLLKVSNSERIVSQFLELSDKPTSSLAYDFFSTANPSQFILAQNQLLSKFIESENETEIGTMFFLSSNQSEFITNIFEQFQNINKIKTEA